MYSETPFPVYNNIIFNQKTKFCKNSALGKMKIFTIKDFLLKSSSGNFWSSCNVFLQTSIRFRFNSRQRHLLSFAPKLLELRGIFCRRAHSTVLTENCTCETWYTHFLLKGGNISIVFSWDPLLHGILFITRVLISGLWTQSWIKEVKMTLLGPLLSTHVILNLAA